MRTGDGHPVPPLLRAEVNRLCRRLVIACSKTAGKSPVIGLTPTPFQSGGMDRDRRISQTGNTRARMTLIRLA